MTTFSEFFDAVTYVVTNIMILTDNANIDEPKILFTLLLYIWYYYLIDKKNWVA